tara:strand:+ start:6923 stop:7117 length:195 start_codon:yes stop_codon:yes gene_type:complete
MENSMKCVNDEKQPTLVGIIDHPEDYKWVNGMVKHMNKELKDSGFDQHQFSVKKEGKKLYIEKD